MRQVERAPEVAGIGTHPRREADAPVAAMIARCVNGFAELSIGRPGEAHRFLGPLVRQMRSAGVREPGAMRFVVDDAEALVELGALDEAEDLIAWFERCARAVRRESALAACARVRGLLAAARGEREPAVEAFERALRHHDHAPFPFDGARTVLALGMTQRRFGQKRVSRESLEQSLAIFRRLGAAIWAARAETELARIGGRTTSGQLTPTERRVAGLVAEGRSNKEVAGALFVTVKTVEATLSRVYAKLGVPSRAALAYRFPSIGEEPPPKL